MLKVQPSFKVCIKEFLKNSVIKGLLKDYNKFVIKVKTTSISYMAQPHGHVKVCIALQFSPYIVSVYYKACQHSHVSKTYLTNGVFKTYLRCMPFGLCNAPATFQRYIMVIFTNMVENFLEVFTDDFLCLDTLMMIV
ncbi:RNA-directed DNA polymerase-like protein [Gossypium australe]|uniref:RNA-directed DNA polymerase-like protein n=1 Tax=Gossypium australe TaxID=47621 RepID=A0A5B6W7W7_9ROSI|nr:RNA-directed DNA polymerase-like protein [Gossypium australe]